MLRNLKPFAKSEQGVFWWSPQDEGVSQKRDKSSSLDTDSDDHNQGSQDALP